jgi:hypothetical protein
MKNVCAFIIVYIDGRFIEMENYLAKQREEAFSGGIGCKKQKKR